MTFKKVVITVGLVAVAFLALARSDAYMNARQWLPDRHYEDLVLAAIQTEGVDLAYHRTMLIERPRQIDVCVVRRDATQDTYVDCNVQGYAGAALQAIRPGAYQSGLTFSERSRLVTGPDGKQYYLVMWYQVFKGFAWWMVYAVTVALASGWICLALWVHHDATQRGSKARLGWLLLALMTGPVGLAVWLVARTEPVRNPLCQGCGAEMLSGTMFCVRCGHPLHPACPECGKRVEADWDYCGTCGASLGGVEGDKHGLLAHEDGA